jgi:hypothetical protein
MPAGSKVSDDQRAKGSDQLACQQSPHVPFAFLTRDHRPPDQQETQNAPGSRRIKERARLDYPKKEENELAREMAPQGFGH